MSLDGPRRVTCTECPFSEVVEPGGDVLPADIVCSHGRETGHTLRFEALDD